MWFVREQQTQALKKALERWRRCRGVSDLLTYAMLLDDATVLHKDGALSAHFRYFPPDVDASTDAILDYNAQTWSQAFSFLGNGFMVESNVLSRCHRVANESRVFPELVSAVIHDERRLQYQSGFYFQTEHYLSITWKPEKMVASRFRHFVLSETNTTPLLDLSAYQAPFEKCLHDFIGYLQRVCRFERLTADHLTTFLFQCLTGKTHRLMAPDQAAFLNSYLACEDFMGGVAPKLGQQHIAALSLDTLPSHSYPAMLDALSCFPLSYRWSNRFICLEPQSVQSYLKRYARHWSSQAIGLMGVLRESLGLPAKRDRAADETVEQIRDAQTDNASGSVHYGFYNSTVILMNESSTDLDRARESMTTAIQQMDYRVRQEDFNACEAFIGSLPGHGDFNVRKMMVDTNYLGHAFPTSGLFSGEDQNSCPFYGKAAPPLLVTSTKGARPFYFNVHVGDVGHTAILGPTGKGKTTLTALMMVAHRQYKQSRIVVFDKDYSNRSTINALGGDYFDLEKNECQFSPLARVDLNDPMQIDRAVQWLMTIGTIQGISITPTQQTLLRESVLRLAKEDKAHRNLNHLTLQDDELRDAIAAFNSGQYQRLLNGTETGFSQATVIGFEMGALMKTQDSERDFAIPVIKAMFDELERLFADRQPTLLILEEAWLYLRHPLFQKKLAEWFKTLRKFNVAVIFISQDIDEMVQSPIASVIQGACVTRVYLPNESAEQMQASYRQWGLNERQISIIAKAQAKRDYYYQSVLGHRLFQLDLGELTQAFLCLSSKKDLDQLDAIYQKNNPCWVLDWLDYKKLPDWKRYVERQYFNITGEESD